MENTYIAVALAVLGLALGSFVNAAVWRIKEKKDIVRDRSECVNCHHKLSARDLVPVFSWLSLRGKCRYCKKAISWQYPVVEAAVAAYFVLSFLLWPVALDTTLARLDFALWLLYGVLLAILFVYDLRWYLLPDRIVFPLIILGLFDALLRVAGNSPLISYMTIIDEILLPLLPIAGLYGFLYAISRGRWIGFGDVKLGIFLGLALGWPAALVCLFLANLIGFMIVLPALLSKRLNGASRIPFGPFLILGFIIAGLSADKLIIWYLGTPPF